VEVVVTLMLWQVNRRLMDTLGVDSILLEGWARLFWMAGVEVYPSTVGKERHRRVVRCTLLQVLVLSHPVGLSHFALSMLDFLVFLVNYLSAPERHQVAVVGLSSLEVGRRAVDGLDLCPFLLVLVIVVAEEMHQLLLVKQQLGLEVPSLF